MQSKDGIFVSLPGPSRYTILENVPPYSYNIATDARGVEYPLKVTFGAGRWLLRAVLDDNAVFPIACELRNSPRVLFCSIVL